MTVNTKDLQRFLSLTLGHGRRISYHGAKAIRGTYQSMFGESVEVNIKELKKWVEYESPLHALADFSMDTTFDILGLDPDNFMHVDLEKIAREDELFMAVAVSIRLGELGKTANYTRSGSVVVYD